ncbi:MAG: hypothetical protein ACSLFB_03795 [Acidimicrobiales bacterium]
MLLLDDHLLLRVLLNDEPNELRTESAQLYTTGLWYYRLGRAIANTTVTGVLSRSLGSADPKLGTKAARAVTELPATIGLISLRELAWPMAQMLDEGVRLNLMSLEALAAAEHLDAEICLASDDENPHLIAAANLRGIPTRLVGS